MNHFLFQITKKGFKAAVFLLDDQLKVIFYPDNEPCSHVFLDKKHLEKLKTYKSVSALLKYAKANQLDTPSHPSHDLPSDDSLGGVSPSSSVELHPSNDALTDDPHSLVQSPISLADHIANGSLAGESSPVAASSYPATSDTPFSYRDLNTIVHALGHYIDYISKSDLKDLQHINIDFESDRKASILRLIAFTERIKSMAAQLRGGLL